MVEETRSGASHDWIFRFPPPDGRCAVVVCRVCRTEAKAAGTVREIVAKLSGPCPPAPLSRLLAPGRLVGPRRATALDGSTISTRMSRADERGQELLA